MSSPSLFAEDKDKRIDMIAKLYESGLVSLQTAVDMLSLTDKPEEEIRRILEEKREKTQRNEKDKNLKASDDSSQ